MIRSILTNVNRYSINKYFSTINNNNNKITINTLNKKKKDNIGISMLTAYDYSSALHLDKAGIDIALIGDSLGMTIMGYKDTLKVNMNHMIYHSEIVSRICKNAFIVSDLPFGSFESSPKLAVENSIKLVKEGGVDAVKIEGGIERSNIIKRIIKSGIPVMGHIGLQPQSYKNYGGFKVQGRNFLSAKKIYEDAIKLENLGCFAIVIECVPSTLAYMISKQCKIPIIGIGSGNNCDGQVSVYHDTIGLTIKNPSFTKDYCDYNKIIQRALHKYDTAVKNKIYSDINFVFLNENEEIKFLEYVNNDKKNEKK